nr:transposase family protein [candidate division Zixibacteria bacterium]
MQSSRPPKGIATLLEHLSTLQDRRVRGRCLYSLQTVVVIGLLGVLCGAEGWVDLETFARSKQGWLREFLDLRIGDVVPSEKKINAPIEVFVNRRRKYTARPGLAGKKRAFQVIDVCERSSEEKKQ